MGGLLWGGGVVGGLGGGGLGLEGWGVPFICVACRLGGGHLSDFRGNSMLVGF